MKSRVYLSLSLILVSISSIGQSASSNISFEESKEAIVMRMIAHEILLHANDSTSRVLPVKLLSENKYQLQFESDFTFETDSLVTIIHSNITKNKLSSDYLVNVLDCASDDVIFGYANVEEDSNLLVPCSGRNQVENCYLVNIQFADKPLWVLSKVKLGLLFSFLLFSLVLIKRKKGVETTIKESTTISLGMFDFSPSSQVLLVKDQKIPLTNKESKLLEILAQHCNEMVSRDQLQKEVWEDEGVIVGRSLDVFISKLRKKLRLDETLKIVNVHGKGYILEKK